MSTDDSGWDDSGWGESMVTSLPKKSDGSDSAADTSFSGHKSFLHQSDNIRGRSSRGRGYVPFGSQSSRPSVPGIDSWGPSDGSEWLASDSKTSSNQVTLNGNTLSIFIPASETGRVIGRQGSTVKDFQNQSGARINVGREVVNGETKIEISGSDDQRLKAVKLIEKVTGKNFNINGGLSGNTSSNSDYGKSKLNEAGFGAFDWGAAIKESEEFTKNKWASLAHVVKEFYFENIDVANMTPEAASQFRKENNNIIITHFDNADERKLPNPCVTFKQAFERYPDILSEIERNGFEKPSPIQAQSWPVLLQGIDLIGIAQTGTGKTLAYLLPAMIHIEGQTTPRNRRVGPTALIMAPTRELAQQIEREAKKYSYRGIRTICIYGGGDRRDQCDRASSGIEIVIATPGRLWDLCAANVIDLSSVSYLVLDEADRMLDMGFEPQIKKILIDIRPDRQTVMMSATWPSEVRRLAINYMTNPFQIYVNTLDLTACHSVTQKIVFLPFEEKRVFLDEFIKDMASNDKVIVFVGKKIICDEISSDLALKGVDVQCMHGNRDQGDREQALEDLKSGNVKIMIATDVASRGLDIDDITHILNLDFPRTVEEYVHRIGRTGRAGRTGTSITIMSREDWRHAEELIKILEEASQEVPDELRDMARRFKVAQEKKAEEEKAYGIRGRGGGFGGDRSDRNGFGGGFGGRRGGGRW